MFIVSPSALAANFANLGDDLKKVHKAGADYIKTSTGFSTSGATTKDVKILRENSNKNLKVKAAGGISSIADAEEFILLGADRLGTSKVVKAVIEKGE